MQTSQRQQITPEYVLNLTAPTQKFLCPIQANTYGIEFVYFKIRNYENDEKLCEIIKKPEDIGKPLTQAARKIRYHFGPYFFMFKVIGTTLRFKVGPQPVKKFKMIERHYFKNKLIKSYEFQAPFCPPGSTNQMEAIYQLPEFNEEEIEEMIDSPWETVSDSFYFVEDKLIMHTKAEFSYADQQAGASQ